MSHRIEAEFLVDYTGETPERKVRLTLDLASVKAIQQAAYAGGHYGLSVAGAPNQGIEEAFELSAFFRRLMNELESPSLFSMQEFKDTNPPRDAWV